MFFFRFAEHANKKAIQPIRFSFAGFRFQPSEIAKIALIMYMAFSLDRKQDKIKSFGAGFLTYMIMLMLLLALLLQQPDLASATTLFMVAFIMLFAAGNASDARICYVIIDHRLQFFWSKMFS